MTHRQQITVDCIAVPTNGDRHSEMHQYGLANSYTIVFAAWHPNCQYRIFKTGSLLSKNDLYPSGLVIVDEHAQPHPYQILLDKLKDQHNL
jgi:hypothetical protein